MVTSITSFKKARREWLEGKINVSKGYERKLRHMIRTKLSNALEDFKIVTRSPHVTKFGIVLGKALHI